MSLISADHSNHSFTSTSTLVNAISHESTPLLKQHANASAHPDGPLDGPNLESDEDADTGREVEIYTPGKSTFSQTVHSLLIESTQGAEIE